MMIPITLAVEGDIDEAILRRLLELSIHGFCVGPTLGKRGKDYLRSIARGLNRAAQGHPYHILCDLDNDPCPPSLIETWLDGNKHRNLLFSIAVKQTESWLMADRVQCAAFLGVRRSQIPVNTDEINNPKQFLVNLARRSNKRIIRDDLVPTVGSGAKIGPNYVGRLIYFVKKLWLPHDAAENSPSLQRAISLICKLRPNCTRGISGPAADD